MRREGDAKYLVGLRLVPAAVTGEAYPFDLPAVRTLDLYFRRPSSKRISPRCWISESATRVSGVIRTHDTAAVRCPCSRTAKRSWPSCIALEDTAHFQITKGILSAPDRYWKHLRGDSQDEG